MSTKMISSRRRSNVDVCVLFYENEQNIQCAREDNVVQTTPHKINRMKPHETEN